MKLLRLRVSERLRKVIEALRLSSLEESQVGVFIYSGSGTLMIGDRLVPVTLRVRPHDGQILGVLTGAEIRAEFPLDAEAAAHAVGEAVRRTMN